MARKTTPLEPIDSNPRFAAAAAILRILEAGMREVEREADALRLEDHLGDPRRKGTLRTADLKERLKKLRGAAVQKTTEPAPSGDLPPAVTAALQVIRDGSRTPRRIDRKAAIAQLEDDRDLIREAIFVQQPIVDAIRNELVAEQAGRDREAWDALQVRKFRALQALAAIKDEEDDFRSSRIDAGYMPWRSDVLPAVAPRSVLTIGSERDFESEVSRARRMLEESNSL